MHKICTELISWYHGLLTASLETSVVPWRADVWWRSSNRSDSMVSWSHTLGGSTGLQLQLGDNVRPQRGTLPSSPALWLTVPLCSALRHSTQLQGWSSLQENHVFSFPTKPSVWETPLTMQTAGIFGPANQGGCIIRCVGNLADEKL
jgi:hypothetical protein